MKLSISIIDFLMPISGTIGRARSAFSVSAPWSECWRSRVRTIEPGCNLPPCTPGPSGRSRIDCGMHKLRRDVIRGAGPPPLFVGEEDGVAPDLTSGPDIEEPERED